jgi:hypothetical protein
MKLAVSGCQFPKYHWFVHRGGYIKSPIWIGWTRKTICPFLLVIFWLVIKSHFWFCAGISNVHNESLTFKTTVPRNTRVFVSICGIPSKITSTLLNRSIGAPLFVCPKIVSCDKSNITSEWKFISYSLWIPVLRGEFPAAASALRVENFTNKPNLTIVIFQDNYHSHRVLSRFLSSKNSGSHYLPFSPAVMVPSFAWPAEGTKCSHVGPVL